MRGAGRAGGRTTYRPKPIKRANDPLDLVDNTVDLFIGDLPVPPTLTPINDEWSVSDPFEPVDPRDCSKYPASPYCDGDTIRFGPPVGFEVEIRTNGCTTCVYIYPVVGWMKLTPTVICRRDPNCEEDNPPPSLNLDPLEKFNHKHNENVSPSPYKSEECAKRESILGAYFNAGNRDTLTSIKNIFSSAQADGHQLRNIKIEPAQTSIVGGQLPWYLSTGDPDCIDDLSFPFTLTGQRPYYWKTFADITEKNWISISFERKRGSYPWETVTAAYYFVKWTAGDCCGMGKAPPKETPPPPPPPPPFGRDDDRKKKPKDDNMCCNTCRDAKDNSDKLLRELEAIKKILGNGQFKVPNIKRGEPKTETDISQGLEAYGKMIYENQLSTEELKKILGDGKFKILKEFDSAKKKLVVEKKRDANGNEITITSELESNIKELPIVSITTALDYYAKLFANRMGTGEFPVADPMKESLIRYKKDEKIENQIDYMNYLNRQIRLIYEAANTSANEINNIKAVLGNGQFKIPKELDSRNLGQTGTVSSITSGLDYYAKLFATRLGTGAYPIKVPQSLLTGTGDAIEKMESLTDYMFWLTNQLDGLAGEFPVDIEIKDIDPLKEGDQTKKIQLPNIAEAIAEIYGLTIKNSVNQEVELNMLLRLAAEVVATKNATIVAQDYSRANATFLGYKANYKPRELTYNFDFAGANLDPKAKEPVVLEKLLKTVQGYVQGWQIDDKETVVGFLQKLMFSAGIIKAVFFRGKGQQKELQREINSMSKDEAAQEAKFEAFIKEINDPNSRFNKTTQDKPEIKDETPPDQKPKGAK